MKKFGFFLILIVCTAAVSFGQASATALSSGRIITPITIVKTVDMNFGNVAVNATTLGTVVLTPAGTRTKTGGVTLPIVTGTVTAASFTVSGEGTSAFSIQLPAGPLTLSDGSSHTMDVTTFTSTPSGNGALVSGTATVTVGATLNVAAGQAAGTYTNVSGFSVTVNYN